MGTLYFFTAAYPYGIGENWKRDELELLSMKFDKIVIFPLSGGAGNIKNVKLPKNAKCFEPIFLDQLNFEGIKDLKYIFSRHLIYFLNDFFRKKIFLNKNRFIKWLITIKNIQIILKNHNFNKILNDNDLKATYYFYWGLGMADIVPFLNRKKNKKVVVRFHGFDLYEDRNRHYIPFRKELLEHLSIALPCSQFGVEHLKHYYPEYENKIHLQRIGVKQVPELIGKSYTRNSIVTVSGMVPVKRLRLLINSLKYFKTELSWTHFGDGSLRSELETISRTLPKNININFKGHIESNKVIEELINGNYQLFINVSKSEGVPVSIMESFACGIPVLATDAGGTSEIVDNSVGKLIPIDISAVDLANEIRYFLEISKTEWHRLSKNAFQRYNEKCNLNQLTDRLLKKMETTQYDNNN
jgi:glycosyltransferase involved in cell wall biosynthesis